MPQRHAGLCAAHHACYPIAPVSTPPPIRYHLFAPRLPEGDVDLRGVVPGDGPLELEVGFGRGRFLLERAASAPASRILGIEIKAKLAQWLAERITKHGIRNAAAFYGDAREVLPRLGPDACLARAFLLFPDPWWKKRHAKRRVLDELFLEHIARLLAVGGELFVETDVEERYEAMRAELEAHPAFEVRPLAANPYGARTNREARADEDGLPVYRMVALRLGPA